MNDLIIIGAGGFAREVAFVVERINAVVPTWNIIGFTDNEKNGLEMINGYPIIGDDSVIGNYPDAFLVCAVGSSAKRSEIVQSLKNRFPQNRFATLIDPSVIISDYVIIGDGTVICAQSVITVNIKIGSGVIINLDCTIGHDASIGDYATLNPSVNVSGAAVIGECTEIGTGTQIIQGKTIGNYTVIGAGAVVVNDIPDKCTAVGCPAKTIKYF